MFFILMWNDRGKAPTSNYKSVVLVEDVVTDEYIFYSTNPLETIRKLLKKLNMELILRFGRRYLRSKKGSKS
jgi:hypothetical protein